MEAEAESEPLAGEHGSKTEVLRVEMFSDAVPAIALTLPVPGLSANDFKQGSLGSAILHQWRAFMALVASFIYLAVMWMNHHAVLNRLNGVNLKLLWSNMGVMLGAVVLPFPTDVLAEAFGTGNRSDEHSAVLLYGAMAAVVGMTWCLLFRVVRFSPALWRSPGDGVRWRRASIWAFFGGAGYLVAVGAGLSLSPVASLIMFFVLVHVFVLYRSTQAARIRGVLILHREYVDVMKITEEGF